MKNNSARKIIVGNWKMNPESLETAKKLVSDIKRKVSKSNKSIVVLCPPSIFLSQLTGKVSKKIKFGVQNIHFEKSGSFTGEISAPMAKNLKAEYVIIGHSERREMGETNEMICKKMGAALRVGMTPILCVGEKEIDENANYLDFLRDQLLRGLKQVAQQEIEKIIIAYEPVYAIGALAAVSSHQIYQRNIFIKKVLTEKYGKQKSFAVPILYGGSTSVDNAREIIRDGSVDGLLVGRESLKTDNFTEIVKRAEAI